MPEKYRSRRPAPLGPGLRPLSTGERRDVLKRLRKRWPQPDRDWWHPLMTVLADPDSLRLQSSWMLHELPLDAFRERAAAKWSTFWVIGESWPHWDDLARSPQGEFEITSRLLSPSLASETLVTPTTLDWLAYTDHNGCVALIGAWLIDTVKELWPTWEQHVWSSPFDDDPPFDVADYRPWWEN